MAFSEFITIIINSFNSFLNFLINIYDKIISNNWFKLIIFISIIYFVVNFFGEIIELIFNILSMKKANSKQKTSSKTDIE